MKTLKLVARDLLICVLVYTVLAGLLFGVFGRPFSPYWQKKKIDTTGIEKAEMIMWDYPNIIFSASDYIKQSYETLWDKAGLQLYFVALYVEPDISTEEEMLDLIWDNINRNIYMDNAIYVCYSYYAEEDTREDFFIYNHLMFGEEAKEYCNNFFMRTYDYYYKQYECAMKNDVWYTYPDVAALALRDTVNLYNGVNFTNVILAGGCVGLFVLLRILSFISCRVEKRRMKSESELVLEDYVLDVVEEDIDE